MSVSCYNSIQMAEPVENSELLAFAKTVEAKSLSRAALELGVPRATLSRRLARLEQRLESRLLRRSTRSLSLTDAGETLYRHARIVLDAVSEAEASVRRSQGVAGTLRVSVPPFKSPGFRAMLREFTLRYPDVRLQVLFTTEYTDLRRDGYDVAIRAGSELEPGLIVRRLFRTRAVAVASPAYLAAQGEPKSRRDLGKHRCLTAFARGEVPQTEWPLVKGGRLSVQAHACSNDLSLLYELALDGLGIAFLPLNVVGSALESGRLRAVLPRQIGGEISIAVVYPEREFVPAQVRAFVDAAVEWAAKELPRGLRSTGSAA